MKNTIRKYLPDRAAINQLRSLRCLGWILHDTRLWQFNRRSIANAFALGLFGMWLPIPLQMLFVTAVAIPCRANLPLSIALVWISNPLTIAPLYFSAYLFGAWLLQHELLVVESDISVAWLTHSLGQIWEPFILGCLLLGVISGATGYVIIQLLWRYYIARMLERRRIRR